jgi:hypothetical protein
MRAKILNEIINAEIKDIILPQDYKYDWERLVSSEGTNEPIQII